MGVSGNPMDMIDNAEGWDYRPSWIYMLMAVKVETGYLETIEDTELIE